MSCPRGAKPWTAECDQELRDLTPGRTIKEVAEIIGRTSDAVTRRKSILGIRGGPAACEHCGKPLAKRNGRPPRYCDRACVQAAVVDLKAKVVLPSHPCSECGKTFTPTRHGLLYCSKACSNRAWYARATETPELVRARKDVAARQRLSRHGRYWLAEQWAKEAKTDGGA